MYCSYLANDGFRLFLVLRLSLLGGDFIGPGFVETICVCMILRSNIIAIGTIISEIVTF